MINKINYYKKIKEYLEFIYGDIWIALSNNIVTIRMYFRLIKGGIYAIL